MSFDIILDFDAPELTTCDHAAFTDRWGHCLVCADEAEAARLKMIQFEAGIIE